MLITGIILPQVRRAQGRRETHQVYGEKAEEERCQRPSLASCQAPRSRIASCCPSSSSYFSWLLELRSTCYLYGRIYFYICSSAGSGGISLASQLCPPEKCPFVTRKTHSPPVSHLLIADQPVSFFSKLNLASFWCTSPNPHKHTAPQGRS